MDENLSLLKQQAYYKGYLDGYRRGVEDAAVGRAGTQTESGKLDCPIQFLNLSVRPFNCLDRAGFHSVRELVSLNRQQIWAIRNLGIKGLREIAEALHTYGIGDSAWSEWLYSEGK